MTDFHIMELSLSAADLIQITGLASPLFAAESSWLMDKMLFFYNIFLVALGLGFVIFVHELGHFLAAKMFGVQCDKFYIGFDPPIKIGPIRLPSKLLHFQWGETEYGIGIIPLGGYVKMLGQDDDPRNAKAEAERSKSDGEPGKAVHNPRSFLAKSVGARMVIISAGVIMNLIFGVLMAAVAFYIGVPYNPAVIGRVIPGDPAWKAGIEAGDKIHKVNDREDAELAYREMHQRVLFAGLSDPKSPIEVGLTRQGQSLSKRIIGTQAHSDPARPLKFLALGLRNTQITKVSAKYAISKELILDPAYSQFVAKLEPGDIITGVNGETLPISAESDVPLAIELSKMLEPRLKEDVELQVSRLAEPDNKESTKRIDVTVSSRAVPMKTLGFYVMPGPIAAIAPDSWADKSEIKPGFRIVAWEGNPIRDAFGLAFDVASRYGKSTNITYQKDDGSTGTLEWTVPDRFQVNLSELTFGAVGLELPGSGIVYSISNVVSGVATGSKAAEAGLQAGDLIIQTQIQPTSKEDIDFYKEVLDDAKSIKEPQKINEFRNMHYTLTLMQLMRSGMPVEVNYERGSKVNTCKLEVFVDQSLPWPERGFELLSLSKNYKVDTVGEAMVHGFNELWRRGGNVLEFLGLLVRGKLPISALGGPGSIAVEANDAASKGISPLLMFLTMLSANLAIINFLPIPALDGGHMVFLTYEAVKGKPANEEFEARVRLVGVLALLLLMILVIFNDVVNISAWVRG